nr:methionyl-trna formyltransferase [Quercus suber]
MGSAMPMCQSDIAIVGGGACGIAVLSGLVENFKLGTPIRLITVFESASTVGPGLAYSRACEGTGLNMRSETMSLYREDPSHFLKWIQEEHPEVDVDEYLPRMQYGEYLASLSTLAKEEAAKLGCTVQSISNEVVALNRADGGFEITDLDGRKYYARKAVLALGNHMVPKHDHLRDDLGYFSSPWPNNRFKIIPRESSVSVIGSRLTALDIALCLRNNGHIGRINLISRSGRLPKVQAISISKKGRFRLYDICRDLEKNSEGAFARLVAALRTEIDNEGRHDWSTMLETSANAHTELDMDIRQAERGNIKWQDVINATSPVVERYWRCFNAQEKKQFLARYYSTWMTFRHAMPLVTARKISGMMSTGQLQVLQINGKLEKAQNGFQIPCKSALGYIHTDYVIEGTGPESDPLRLPSKLIHSCLGARLLKTDPLGGIKVDPTTLQASKDLYMIGSLTRGTHFYSTAIDRNVVHSERIVDSILGKSPRRPLHIAFFVGTDICSQLIISKLVPKLLCLGHMPYVFLPAHKTSKRASKFELKELAFFERQLFSQHIAPLIESTYADGTPCLSVDQFSSCYGILVQRVADVNDSTFLAELSSHHIDVGMSIRCYQKFGSNIINFFQSPRQGLLNLHPGSLPRYRGVMTMIRAMANEEREFGFSLHSINEDWDAGGLIDIQRGPIVEGTAMLSNMIALHEVGVKVAIDVLGKLARGTTVTTVPQDEGEKHYYTFPTSEELEDYRRRGLKIVDAKAMENFFVTTFSTPVNRDKVSRTVRQAIREWYAENNS